MKILRGIMLCVSLVFCIQGLSAQAMEWLWSRQAGGSGYDQGMNIATDSQGNQYVTGYFTDTASFGSTSLTSYGDFDIFIAKLDCNGNFLWAVHAGGTMSDKPFGITVDAAANVYITGYFRGTAQFGSVTLTDNGMFQAFVAKLDTNGNFLWAVQGGGAIDDIGYNLVVDTDSNILLTGYFEGNASFGTHSLSSGGYKDIFIAKLDTSGNWLWVTGAGWIDADDGYGIRTDNNGNCYLTGSFKGMVSFGSFTLISSGNEDIFVAKLDSSGTFLWAVKAGGQYTDWGYDIALDPSGNSYITGVFNEAADFGSHTLTGSGLSDTFVAKLDHNGTFLWAVKAGGTSYDSGYGIVLDTAGNLYVTGGFSGAAEFGTTTLHSLEYTEDIYIAKLDSNGNFLSVIQAGGTGPDRGYDIAEDNLGNIYVSGYFWYTGQFGEDQITSVANQDIFVAKLSSGVLLSDELAPGVSVQSSLYAPYPNPLRQGDQFRIKAQIAERETGTFTLCNLRGQVISRRELVEGLHEISADFHELRSGVYLCNLRTGSVNITRKLILID